MPDSAVRTRMRTRIGVPMFCTASTGPFASASILSVGTMSTSAKNAAKPTTDKMLNPKKMKLMTARAVRPPGRFPSAIRLSFRRT